MVDLRFNAALGSLTWLVAYWREGRRLEAAWLPPASLAGIVEVRGLVGVGWVGGLVEVVHYFFTLF